MGEIGIPAAALLAVLVILAQLLGKALWGLFVAILPERSLLTTKEQGGFWRLVKWHETTDELTGLPRGWMPPEMQARQIKVLGILHSMQHNLPLLEKALELLQKKVDHLQETIDRLARDST